jgi:23S rRNA (cytosine1962-C5)-methyltransferase/23S rRNA (guanine2445-N2)-methyltransferase / 23S rRNA (guanine2069-N7)-methyltransferase
MSGDAQYEKLAGSGDRFSVQEGPRSYYVNLTDYLDTGLFLDHRPLRNQFQKGCSGRFLNLFCYTASVSVAAALGGAATTSVDMSNRYLAWAEDNFQLNGIDPTKHHFVREDALKFLSSPGPLRKSFQTIFLDPPTFSNSKKMTGAFDVQRDHSGLIDQAMQFLAPDGKLFFSCNRHKFRIDPAMMQRYVVRDISDASIPRDFRNRRVHVCFEIS